MADSDDYPSPEPSQNSCAAGVNYTGTRPSSDGAKLEGNRGSHGNDAQLVCQKCGAQALTASVLTPSAANPSPGSDGRHSNPTDIAASAGDEEAEPPKRRIGRLIQGQNGEEELVDRSVVDDGGPEFKNGADFVFAIRSEFNWDRGRQGRSEESLVLISPPLATMYRSVVKDSAGSRLGRRGRRTATIAEPFAPLFFYYDDIAEAARKPEFACAEDFDVLSQYYNERIRPEHDRIRALLSEGLVLYDDLWAIFRRGDLVYSVDECGEPCVQILMKTEYRDGSGYLDTRSRTMPRMVAEMWRVIWDHSTGTFNRSVEARSIRPFTDTRAISSLPFYPINYFGGGNRKEIDALLEMLEARGRNWKELMCQKPGCFNYSGPARSVSAHEDEYLDERIIIDGSISRAKLSTLNRTEVLESFRIYPEEVTTHLGMDSEHQHFDNFAKSKEFSVLQAQLCPSAAYCYAVQSRNWYEVSISRIKKVDWKEDAVDQLVLEEKTKKMLIGLVKQHQANKDRVMGDIIPSKGKGLVVVLHGSPGVGKTLTAEVIAEYTKKALYPINIGELTSEDRLVSKLQWHFTTASRWDTVLLLDEADVLLEMRSYEDFKRNGIVSVFLRMLEYYDGMLFLTTNRIMTIDPAFQSRIHIAIKFPDLTPATRRKIWVNFINRLDEGEMEGKRELEEHLDDMQEWELNGRQIRNILTISEAMALSLQRRRGALRYRQVEEVANQTLNFQNLFGENTKEQKAHLGNLNRRQFQERRVPRALN